MRVRVQGKRCLSARTSSIGVAEVPVSSSRRLERSKPSMCGFEDARPHQGDRVEPIRTAPLDARSSASGVGVRTRTISPRVCQAASASVKAAMWKNGNMQTRRSGSSRNTPWKLRSQLARCESTTPLGRPVLPLVKNSTCGSLSRRAGSTTSSSRESVRPSAAPAGDSGRRGAAASASAACAASATSSRARASFARSAASSRPSRALSGANTAPSLASATKAAARRAPCPPRPTTRSPWPTPSARRAWARGSRPGPARGG